MVYTLFWQVPVIGTWQVATHSPPISTLNSKPDGPADVASSRILQPHSLPAQIQNDPLIAIILILALATFCYFTNIISHSAGQSWSEKSTELKAGAGGIAPLSSYLINVSLYGASAAWATHDWICGPDSSWEAATEIPCIVPCRSARIALNSLYPRVHFLYIYIHINIERNNYNKHMMKHVFGLVVSTWWWCQLDDWVPVLESFQYFETNIRAETWITTMENKGRRYLLFTHEKPGDAWFFLQNGYWSWSTVWFTITKGKRVARRKWIKYVYSACILISHRVDSLCTLSAKLITWWCATRPWYHIAGGSRMVRSWV